MSDNPFEPPRSDIRVDESAGDRRLGWKIFFLVMFLLNIFGYYVTFSEAEYQIQDILELFVYAFALLALFGYAFKKAFFQQVVWKAFLPISLVTDISSLFSDFDDVLSDTGGAIAIVSMLVIVVPILLLQYLILYRYGYTDREPWRNKEASKN